MYLLIVWALMGEIEQKMEIVVDECPTRHQIRVAFDYFEKQDIYITVACKRNGKS